MDNTRLSRKRRSTEEVRKERKKARHFAYLLVLFALLMALYFGGCYYFENHFLPGTKVNNIDCSLMTADGAFKKVSDALSGSNVVIRSEEPDEVIQGDEVGLYYENNGDLEDILIHQDSNNWFIDLKNNHSFDVMEIDLDYDMLYEKVETLACMSPSEPRTSENPLLVYNETNVCYDIVEGQIGNDVDEDKLAEAVKNAFVNGLEVVDLSESGCYLPAQYDVESDVIVQAKAVADKYVKAQIHYTSGDKELTLSGKQIHKFVSVSSDYQVSLDDDAIDTYIKKKLAKKFDTGKLSVINSPGSGTIYVITEEGDKAINKAKEKKNLLKVVKAGETQERTPVYIKEYLYSSNGKIVEDDYIDINLSDQKVYVVMDDEIQISTSCVSGNISTGHGSPTGIYRIAFKERNYTMVKYNAFVNYWMPYDTDSGIGLHDATWRSEFGGDIYEYDGSHGCINLPLSKAASIYDIVYTGMPVVVHY